MINGDRDIFYRWPVCREWIVLSEMDGRTFFLLTRAGVINPDEYIGDSDEGFETD